MNDVLRFILFLISLIYSDVKDDKQLVRLNSNYVIIQEGAIEIKLFLELNKPIKIICLTLNHGGASSLIGSLLFEISTIVEYSFKKYKIFYRVFHFFSIFFKKKKLYLSRLISQFILHRNSFQALGV